MSNRNRVRTFISKDLDNYLQDLSRELSNKTNWRRPVKKTEASRYLAQLLNKKSTLRLKKKKHNIIDMDLIWDE